ncbi:MAG: hypothetical protein JW714_00875, partial [Candidatus Omnitrophica bacterium]|nr:hypothetical protein [Candidatus Omnitrophota bacterium]
SLAIRKRVEQARIIQQKRYAKEGQSSNANIKPKQIEKYCYISNEAKELLKIAIYDLGLSARAYDKVLKIGRSIADLAASELITAEHICEAISYRSLDRNIWMR